MKMYQRSQQAGNRAPQAVDIDSDIPELTPPEEYCPSSESTRAQYGDAHSHTSRGATAPQNPHSLTTAALAAHLKGEQGTSRRGPAHDDTLAQVGTRDPERRRRHRRRRSPRAAPQVRDTADEAAAAAGQQTPGRADGAAPLERRPKTVHFNPLTTRFGDPAGPEYGDILPPAPAKPRGYVEEMLDRFGDLRACYC